MSAKPWHRVVTVKKTQREEYTVIYGLNDRGVDYAQAIGKGRDPIAALTNAMLRRCDHALVRRMVEGVYESLVPGAEKASTRVARLDAELEGVDAGISSSRAAARARRQTGQG